MRLSCQRLATLKKRVHEGAAPVVAQFVGQIDPDLIEKARAAMSAVAT